MPSLVEQGSTPIFDGTFEQSDGTPADAPDATVSIVDATGTTVVNLDAPTHVGVGLYQYAYAVAANASPGAWSIRWAGTVDGDLLTAEEAFTVVRVGALSPGLAGGQTCTPWATHEDAQGACADYGVDPDDLDVWMQVATDILWNLTGRRWSGICSDYVRPNAQFRRSEAGPLWWAGSTSRGLGMTAPWGWCSCHRGRETGCAAVPEIRLTNSPVDPDSVVVRVDGDLLDPADYRVDDGRFLVRLDGDAWPCCQDMLSDDDAPNTFSIAYDYDRRPPIGGQRAAALYGCQLSLASNPSTASGCALPTNVVQVVRQGTTTRFSDPMQLVEKGLTGLGFVDQWVASVLTGDSRRRATAMVPGMTKPVRRPG